MLKFLIIGLFIVFVLLASPSLVAIFAIAGAYLLGSKVASYAESSGMLPSFGTSRSIGGEAEYYA